MEWIGWISLAIVVAALIFLAISAVKTFKSIKPKMDHLKTVQRRIQTDTNNIKSETDELNVHKEHIMADVDHAKQAVTLTVNETKQLPQNAKFLVKTAVDSTKQKKRAKA